MREVGKNRSPRRAFWTLLAGVVLVSAAIFRAAPVAADQQLLSSGTSTSKGNSPQGGFLVDFSRGFESTTQYLSDFDMDTDWLFAAFRKTNVLFGKDGMFLLARRTENEPTYTVSEFQRQGFYGYGRYEVVMRPSGVGGVVSSFFTHTGTQFGDPHSEIDFEFVGKYPRQVHLNYYTEGQDDPQNIDLWFDPAREEHLYAFEWSRDSIAWYVDGVKVREVASETSPIGIPTHSGRLIMNVLTGNRLAEAWIGTPDFERTSSLYRCVSHVPLGERGPQCSDVFKVPATSEE